VSAPDPRLAAVPVKPEDLLHLVLGALAAEAAAAYLRAARYRPTPDAFERISAAVARLVREVPLSDAKDQAVPDSRFEQFVNAVACAAVEEVLGPPAPGALH